MLDVVVVLTVVVIASKYCTLEGQGEITLCIMTDVIFARRRDKNNIVNKDAEIRFFPHLGQCIRYTNVQATQEPLIETKHLFCGHQLPKSNQTRCLGQTLRTPHSVHIA